MDERAYEYMNRDRKTPSPPGKCMTDIFYILFVPQCINLAMFCIKGMWHEVVVSVLISITSIVGFHLIKKKWR